MSKFKISKFKILAVIVLTVALAGAVYAAPGRGGGGGFRGGGGGFHGGGAHFGGGARFSGARIGGGARFSGRPAISRFAGRPSYRGGRSFAVRGNSAGRRAALNANRNTGLSGNRSANVRANAVRNVLSSRAIAGALHNRTALHNPNTRALIAASAATAGWHNGRGGGNGWWQHRNGGYGWVGPLFWPFAYYDFYDYAMWGYDPFWDYGYDDIYAGLFSPYGYDDLTGYLPQSASDGAMARAGAPGTPAATPDQLAQMCGDDSRDIAGLPIDRIQQAIQPDDAQRAALDDLANASVKAAQDIKAACPKQIALTAPTRLAAMQTRIEAMINAVGTVQPPLQKFYGLLNDEQKVKLNALGQDRQDQRRDESTPKAGGAIAQNCGATRKGVTEWPAAEIDAKLHPTEAQRASLAALQDASVKAADMLKTACQSGDAITPPARLEAVGKRLDVMLQAVKTVRAALDEAYAKLSDEQKAQFEAIGPRRTASLSDRPASDQPTSAPARGRRHHHRFGIAGMIRRFMWMAW
jgi:hypothetical protein